MDKQTRNLIFNTTQAIKRLLEEEFALQLEGSFDVISDGRVAEKPGPQLTPAEGLVRRRIVDAIQHRRAVGESDLESVRGYLSEAVFTFLNRIAALKMMEARGLLLPCVSQGDQSQGFKEFSGLAPGLIELHDHGYRLYLECLFDEIGREVGVLFDRTDAASQLWPRRKALEAVLERLNVPALAGVWAEDETIGWIYQYYNDPEERRRMREESAAPRNSHEMAVRNQFFTPRYVVEFLTDNSLGRLWYEMTQGETSLRKQCRYLIRHPDEIFLTEPDSNEVRAAQDWLQNGGDERPDVWHLAHAVNGYIRSGNAGEASNRWVEERLPRIKLGTIAALTTQELLDLLFLFCRKERFCEGTLDSLKAEIALIFSTIRDRTIMGRRIDLSREELIRQPVFIPHRALKDPRTILVLDPACGSMHFGLYAFDLLEVIYSEWWDSFATDDQKAGVIADSQRGQKLLVEEIAGAEAQRLYFLRQVPRLIIEHNLHGVDIDPRCAQIAGLSLWLRAQKAWQGLGMKPAERPAIRRSNIVCAEPMPGEKNLLREFVESQFASQERGLFLQLLEIIFEKMRLAGEAGSLLKIEDEIKSAIEEAQQAWAKRQTKPRELFGVEELNLISGEPELTGLDEAISQLTAEDLTLATDFWDRVEGQIYKALRDYAEQAENGGGFKRRLFADDAARGFAFIDLCRRRYDVALMNPPFGDASLPSKGYLDETYGDTKGDVYKAFVECYQARLVPAGYLGIISSRTGFFLGQSEDWRTRVVLRLFRPITLADLGVGVLDAMVEVAAYVLRSLSADEDRDLTLSLVPVLTRVVRDKQDRFSLPKWQTARNGLKRHQAVTELERLKSAGFIQSRPGDFVRFTPLWHAAKKAAGPPRPIFPPMTCVRALVQEDKAAVLAEAVTAPQNSHVFTADPGGFSAVPGSPFSYWVPQRFRDLFCQLTPMQGNGRHACVTNQVGEDFRYYRASWEVAPSDVGRYARWVPLAKGGTYSPYYSDLHLVVDWQESRGTYTGFIGTEHRPLERPASANHFFRPGITWPRRTDGLSFRILPGGAIFSNKGPAIFCDHDDGDDILFVCALLCSSVFGALLATQLGRVSLAQSYEVGLIQVTPFPIVAQGDMMHLARLARNAWREKRALDKGTLTSHAFEIPALLIMPGKTLAERAAAWEANVRRRKENIVAIQAEIDDLAFRLYGLDDADRAALTATLTFESNADGSVAGRAVDAADDIDEAEATVADMSALAAELLAYSLGSCLGRWDVLCAIGQKPTAPDPDPFDPLPVCSAGMLQNTSGLPADPADVPIDYPLRISWSGILVDDPHHPEDIGQRPREFFELLWPDRADDMEQETCSLLGVNSLREYFRKPTGFFGDHLKRYSKSRRQAPIYWPLSGPNNLYTVWIYYHRLTADTLFTVLRDCVKPKLEYEERRAFQLKQEAGPMPSPSQRRGVAEAEELVEDLRAFRDELNRVAPLFSPDLNDGVIINHAPLWRMIGLPRWQKECLSVWEELVKGDHDWSHQAMHLWPERIVPKCTTDRSLAIAHSLDEFFWQDDPTKPGKYVSKKVSDTEVQSLIASRSSPAVRAALVSLCGVGQSEGLLKRRRKKASA